MDDAHTHAAAERTPIHDRIDRRLGPDDDEGSLAEPGQRAKLL